ncbi:MAG: HD domain-containing protein [Thermodesulfobacteriota bacterium]
MDRSEADFLFEARFLKAIPRSGFAFLGAGRESVAEHVYLTTIVAYVLSFMVPHVDRNRLMFLCLFHDLPETRIGDLNSVQKSYHRPQTGQCLKDLTDGLIFGGQLAEWMHEFETANTQEALLARDADQIALIVELKWLLDHGTAAAGRWIDSVRLRVQTEAGRSLTDEILKTESDAWWWRIVHACNQAKRLDHENEQSS